MFQSLLTNLGHQPFILLFLLVAIGYVVGRVSFKGVGLGATASTLLASLAVSLWAAKSYGIKLAIPEFASSVFFNLFMFSVGMKVGPQFLSGLRRDAKRFLFVGALIPALALAMAFLVKAIFHPESGLLTGIFAGANTATPGLGAAQAAYSTGAAKLHGAPLADAVATMSTAFAFSYCISMVLFIVLMKVPDMLGAKTEKEAQAFEAAIRGASSEPLPGSSHEFFRTTVQTSVPVALRTYEIEKPDVVGRPLGELRRAHPFVSVERVVRDGTVIEPSDELSLRLHDEVTVFGPITRLAKAGAIVGPEVYDRVARDIGAETADVVVNKASVVGRTLASLARDVGHGLFLNAMFRAGDAIPFGPDTVVEKGDVLRITGAKWRIKILESEAGRVIRPSLSTDIATLALGLALGGLIGAITIPVAGIKLTLGSAVGLLVVGIGLSTLRTRHPALGGPYPEPARQLIEDLGLNVFIAILGINSGAGVVKAISEGAVTPILVGTVLIGFVPPVVAWVIGRRVLKMNLALLLGAVSGGRCNSAGMRAAQEATKSTVPAISYPVTFAISNIILTLLSYLMPLIA
jgi:putative transport protein